MRRGRRRCALLLCAHTALFALACSDAGGGRERALLIGIDGATFTVARPLLDAGRLPNLARIEAQGVSGPLRSFFPLLSPRIWTSMATSRRPAEHGITGWVYEDDEGSPHLYSSSDRRVPALWNILTAHGRTVAVINWLMTQPPEKINGVMVSDHAAPGAEGNQLWVANRFATKMFPDAKSPVDSPGAGSAFAYPEEWFERVARLRGEDALLAKSPNPFSSGASGLTPEIEQVLTVSFDSDLFAMRASLDVEQALHPDLLMVYLPGIDRASHMLWASFEAAQQDQPETQPLPEKVRIEAAALITYYERTDAFIGLLLERYSERDLVLVGSDHGFELVEYPDRIAGGHDSVDARDGVLFLRGAGISSDTKIGGFGILDVTPTVLAWFGIPVADDMEGRPIIFQDREPAPPIAHHDVGPIERVGRMEDDVEDRIIERLRQLGYIE